MRPVLNGTRCRTEEVRTSPRKAKKRKSNLSTSIESKRLRDDEKENLVKSSTTSPISEKSVQERRSPRILKKQKELVEVPSSSTRRKQTVPRNLASLTNSTIIQYRPEEILDRFFVKKKLWQPYLCRNVLKVSKILERNEKNKIYDHYPRYTYMKQNTITFSILRKLRIKAMKQQRQLPLISLEFEKINDWTHAGEELNINYLTARAHIQFFIAILDRDDQLSVKHYGFALSPLFKEIEENLSEAERARLCFLKLRQLTCDIDELRNAKEVYVIVEASRYVTNEFYSSIINGKRRRLTKKPSNADVPSYGLDSRIDPNDYTTIKGYGCKKISSWDSHSGKLSVAEGRSVALLHDDGEEGVSISDRSWMKNLDLLRKIDSRNNDHTNSYHARLIFNSCDIRVRKMKFDSPKKEKVIEERTKISYVLRRNSHDTKTVAWKRDSHSFLCPLTGLPGNCPNDVLIQLRIRYPCFRYSIKETPNVNNFTVNIWPDEEYFTRRNANEKYINFAYKRIIKREEETVKVPQIIERMPKMNKEKEKSKFRKFIYPSIKYIERKDSNGLTTSKFPLENTRVIDEISSRLKEIEHLDTKPSTSKMSVLNYELSTEQVNDYKERQLIAVEEVVKNNNRKMRKKKGKARPSTVALNLDSKILNMKIEKIREGTESSNGGTVLDIEGNTIPVPGVLLFPGCQNKYYNVLFRSCLAQFGHKFGSFSIERRSNIMVYFIENYGQLIFEKNLGQIYLKHIECICVDNDSFKVEYYMRPFEKFIEMQNKFGK